VEQDFYTIAAEDVEEPHRVGHDPEAVERALAGLESEVSRIIGAVLGGEFLLPPEHRFKLSLFAALQVTRGWRFRKDMNDLGTLAMRQYVETLPLGRFREWLQSQGKPGRCTVDLPLPRRPSSGRDRDPAASSFTDQTVAVRDEVGGIRRELHRVSGRIPREPATIRMFRSRHLWAS
jgi:hypothetical protein